MTLVLTYVEDRFAIQASDRRLVRPSGQLFEDEENKAIVFEGIALVGYTGLARLGRTPTASYLRDELARLGDLAAVRSRLPKVLSLNFQALPRPTATKTDDWERAKRTSVVIGGFAAVSNGPSDLRTNPEGFQMYVAVYSNAEQRDGTWLNTAQREYVLHEQWMRRSDGYLLRSSGQDVPPDLRRSLLRDVNNCRSRVAHPEPLARLLTRCIRSVAERNPAVGRSVMCTILRAPSREGALLDLRGRGFPIDGQQPDEASLFASSSDEQDVIRYIYSPGDASHQSHYGPTCIHRGLVVDGIWSGPARTPPVAFGPPG